MRFWFTQIVNSLSLAMLLLVLSAGFSIVFGVMRVVNLAHGAFYLLGGYVALDVMDSTGNFLFAVLAASVVVAAAGGVLLVLLRAPAVRDDSLQQVLLTFGLGLVIGDLILVRWGGSPELVPRPSFLDGSVDIGFGRYPSFRLAVAVLGLVLGVALWFLYERTRLGAVVRATVDDREMAAAVGISTGLVSTGVFLFGAVLAGAGGALGGPLLGLRPGLDFEVLGLALVVVVLGGLGSLGGAMAGSLLVALAETFGRVYVPEFALLLVFAPAALVLVVKPTGLFGR